MTAKSLSNAAARLTASAFAALSILCAASAPALAAGDAEKGAKLTKQWCSSCHATEADAATASDRAPPFAAIAARRDAKWIKAWLTEPHPPMKGIELSRSEIDDITAYIKSLAPKTP